MENSKLELEHTIHNYLEHKYQPQGIEYHQTAQGLANYTFIYQDQIWVRIQYKQNHARIHMTGVFDPDLILYYHDPQFIAKLDQLFDLTINKEQCSALN